MGHEPQQVLDVQEISNLFAGIAKSIVLEVPTKVVRCHPQGDVKLLV